MWSSVRFTTASPPPELSLTAFEEGCNISVSYTIRGTVTATNVSRVAIQVRSTNNFGDRINSQWFDYPCFGGDFNNRGTSSRDFSNTSRTCIIRVNDLAGSNINSGEAIEIQGYIVDSRNQNSRSVLAINRNGGRTFQVSS